MKGLLHFRVIPVLAVAFTEAHMGGCVLAELSQLCCLGQGATLIAGVPCAALIMLPAQQVVTCSLS